MAHDPAVADLESFLAERGEPLLRTAVLLTGSKEAGEDLLQAGLERLLRHRSAIVGDPEGYLRRTLYNLAADGWRRQRAWRRRLPLLQTETATAVADGTREVDTRDALIRLLVQLPPRQRAVIVARYWEQLSEAETAMVLGCSVGSSQGVRLAGAAAAARAQRDQHRERPGRGEDTMSADLEQQLRGAMERFTGDVRVPPGLALKAYRHHQKRRTTGRVAAAAGTATVVAGSLAVAGAAGAFGSASRAPVRTAYTAYVISHVEHALAAPRIGNLVEADRTVFSPGSTLQPFPDVLLGSAGSTGSSSPWSASYTLRWIYHGAIRLSSFTAGGQRVFDWRATPAARNHRGDLRQRHLVDGGGAAWPGRVWPRPIQLHPGPRH